MKKQTLHPARRPGIYELLFAAAGTLVAFLALAMLARQQLIIGPELEWFWQVHTWSDRLKTPMLFITQFGSVAMALVVIVWSLWRYGRLFALQLAVTSGMAYVLVSVAKWWVARPRPVEYLYGVVARTAETGMGFPSGHTAMATAISVFLAWRLGGWWRWAPFVWIPLVGISRIYLGVHMPFDIFGGVLVGVLAVLLYEVAQKPITHYLRTSKTHKTAA